MTGAPRRPGRPRCPACRHLVTVHSLGPCWCGCLALRPPELVREVTGTALGRLVVMAALAQRGMAAAESSLARGDPPDAVAAEHARQGYTAAVDLVRALTMILEEGRMPDPARRWLLGVPDAALPHRRRDRG